jgi:hypothetical protein
MAIKATFFIHIPIKTLKMKKIYLAVALGLSIVSCSPENDENNQEPTPQPGQTYQKLSQMTGGDDVAFLYQDGKIIKGLGNSTSEHDDYYSAFQVFYNSNNQVEKVLESEDFFDKPTDFSFDLTSEDSHIEQVYNYHYEGDRLKNITDDSGEVIMEFTYNSNGFITELYEAYGSNKSSDYFITKYYYNSVGELESYTATGKSSGSSYTKGGEIKTDDAVNPLFYHWQTSNLIIPANISGLSNYNVIGYPHNVTEIYDGGELDFKAQIEYDETDHPVYYRETLRDTDAVVFEYAD